MERYEDFALRELLIWQRKMTKKPTISEGLAKGIQDKVNSFIPEKAHKIVTEAIKNMVKAVIVGSEYTTGSPIVNIYTLNISISLFKPGKNK